MNQATSLDPELFYKTRDMVIVSYLRIQGYQPQNVEWVGETCFWSFDKTDGLLSLIDKYAAGDTTVEPKEFNRAMETTRREFYDSDPDPAPKQTRRHR